MTLARSDVAGLARLLRGSLQRAAAEVIGRFEALEGVLGSSGAATAAATASTVMARDSSGDTAVRRLHATDAVDFTAAATVAPTDQATAATAGKAASYRAGKGLGAVGGKATYGGGDGGTPGTDLAGGTDVQLGAANAAGVTALFRLISGATSLLSFQQSSAGIVDVICAATATNVISAGYLIFSAATSLRLGTNFQQIIMGLTNADAVAIGNTTLDVVTFSGPIRLTPIDKANVVAPAAGSYSLFLDSTNSNRWSKKDSAGVVTLASA